MKLSEIFELIFVLCTLMAGTRAMTMEPNAYEGYRGFAFMLTIICCEFISLYIIAKRA